MNVDVLWILIKLLGVILGHSLLWYLCRVMFTWRGLSPPQITCDRLHLVTRNQHQEINLDFVEWIRKFACRKFKGSNWPLFPIELKKKFFIKAQALNWKLSSSLIRNKFSLFYSRKMNFHVDFIVIGLGRCCHSNLLFTWTCLRISHHHVKLQQIQQ